MCTQDCLKQVLSAVYGHAVKLYGHHLNSVILYGSYARGDFDNESDIDIMVLVDLPADRLRFHRGEWAVFGSGLDLEYGVVTAIKLQDLPAFNQRKDLLPFYQNVLKEGVRVSA